MDWFEQAQDAYCRLFAAHATHKNGPRSGIDAETELAASIVDLPASLNMEIAINATRNTLVS